MAKYHQKKRAVSTTQTIKVLRENDVEVSEKDAQEILDFLYLLAEIVVKHYFSDKG